MNVSILHESRIHFVPILVAGLINTVLAHRIKLILRSRGYRSSFFQNTSHDLALFRQLINAETNPASKLRYVRVQTGYRISSYFFFWLFVAFAVFAIYSKWI